MRRTTTPTAWQDCIEAAPDLADVAERAAKGGGWDQMEATAQEAWRATRHLRGRQREAVRDIAGAHLIGLFNDANRRGGGK